MKEYKRSLIVLDLDSYESLGNFFHFAYLEIYMMSSQMPPPSLWQHRVVLQAQVFPGFLLLPAKELSETA